MAERKRIVYDNSKFQPPRVTVRLIEGDRLVAATRTLTESATAADREARAAVEEQQRLLAPEVTNARVAYDKLLELEKEHAEPIKALRAIEWDSLRFKLSEDSLRVSAEAWTRQLWSLLSHTRDVLLNVAARVERLTSSDLEERTFMAEQGLLSGVLPRDARLPRVPTMIRVDVVRAIASVVEIEKRLAEIPDRLAGLAVAVERAARIRSDAARTMVTVIPPDELDRRAAANPYAPLQTRADGADFDPRS